MEANFMKLRQNRLILLLVSLLLTGCNSPKPSEDDIPSDSEQISETTSEVPSEGSEDVDNPVVNSFNDVTYPEDAHIPASEEYLKFWHPKTKINVNIKASNEIIKLIDECGDKGGTREDLYFPVNVTFNVDGKEYFYEEVGMRQKGNTSREDFSNDGNIYGPFHFKLSFTEKWTKDVYAPYGLQKDWTKDDPAYVERDDRRFLDMKKVDFKWNRTNDPSLTNQPFIANLYQKYGLITSNITLCDLKISNSSTIYSMGVYTIYEVIDKTLLRRYLPKKEANGDLYKCTWSDTGQADMDIDNGDFFNEDGTVKTRGKIGEEDKSQKYEPSYDIKTNEDETTHEDLVNLLKMLKSLEGKDVSQTKELVDSKVDVDYFLRYSAVAYLVGNQDDMRNNANNYYTFFNSKTNLAGFITYDNDWSLGVGYDGNGGLEMTKIALDHSKLQGNGKSWQRNRLFWATIISPRDNSPYQNKINLITEYQSQYIEDIKTILNDGFFMYAKFKEMYDLYYNNYRSVSTSFNTNSTFRGTALFKEYEEKMRANVEYYTKTD